MDIRRKTEIIIGVALIGLLLLLIVVSEVVVIGGFHDLERKGAENTMNRVIIALSNDLSLMNTMNGEWTNDEAVHAFFFTPDNSTANALLNDSNFERMQFNTILFFDPSGTLIAGKMYDLNQHQEIPLPRSLLAAIIPKNRLNDVSDTYGVTGILSLDEGPMLISMRQVHTNGNNGPVLGSILMGRYLDQQIIEQLSSLTNVRVEQFGIDDSTNPGDVIYAKNQIPKGEPYFLKVISEDNLESNAPQFLIPVNDTAIASYARVNDIFNAPALIIRIIIPRDIYSQGKSTATYFIIILFIACLSYGIVILWLIESTILSRIAFLNSEISGVAVAGDFSMRVTPGGDDEIGHLGRSINWMLNELEKALRDVKTGMMQREDQYNILFKQSSDMIFIVSLPEGDTPETIREANDTACTILGYTREELLNSPVRSVFGTLFSQETENILANMKENCVKKGEFSCVTLFKTKSRQTIPVALYARIIHEPTRDGIIMICHEISIPKE
jgi:PAS domain S-box-containing protein